MRQVVISDIAAPARSIVAKKPGRRSTDRDLMEIGNRLRWFREALEISTHAKFVQKTDIARTTYLDAENGISRLGLTSALQLIEKYPELSLDYIYLGRTGALLSLTTRMRIAELMARDKK